MRPAARAAAAIGVLDQYLAGVPAEKALTNWARGARYAGSGDRAAIRDIVFDCLRRKASLAARAGSETGRGLVSACVCEADGMDAVAQVFDGSQHAPAPLTAQEAAQLGEEPELSKAEAFDMPDWLAQAFEASLGPRALGAARELKSRAPVFLRVNLAQATRAEAARLLAEEGIVTLPHETVETALRVTENPRRIANSAPYHNGLIELQDAASQDACATLPEAGRMLDFCAGGGGKALAYGARSKAEVFAHDANPRRMADLPERARRAGRKITQLSTAECKSQAPFDLVLTDVPCSGSGTWRRGPEAKWALSPEDLAGLLQTQADILDAAARLISDGGVLAYMTCSVLNEENGAQVENFISRNPTYELAFEKSYDLGSAGDGFYVAHLTRQAPGN